MNEDDEISMFASAINLNDIFTFQLTWDGSDTWMYKHQVIQ